MDDDEVGGPARHAAAGRRHVPHCPLQRVVAVVAVVHSDHHHRPLLLPRSQTRTHLRLRRHVRTRSTVKQTGTVPPPVLVESGLIID